MGQLKKGDCFLGRELSCWGGAVTLNKLLSLVTAFCYRDTFGDG